MRQIISYEMVRLAQLLIFAADLTLEKLNHVMESIEDILEDEKNFDLTKEQPLTLSKKGVDLIKRIDNSLYAPTLMGVLKKIDTAINVSPDKDLQLLDKYLRKSLRHIPGKWINLILKEKDFNKAKKSMSDSAIKPMIHAMDNLTLTPQKRPWEEIEAPPKGMTPEEYAELTRKE